MTRQAALFSAFDASGNDGFWVTDATVAGAYELTGFGGAHTGIADTAGNQVGLGGSADSSTIGLDQNASLTIAGAFANSGALDLGAGFGGSGRSIAGALGSTGAVQAADPGRAPSAATASAPVATAASPRLTTLVSFNGASGKNPFAGLIADAAGDLFGTTADGGADGVGVVFEIAKTGGSYASTPTPLANFNGANGANPQAGLIADAAGNLFGTTLHGGASNDGTVFEIAKTGPGYAGTPTTLVNFNFSNGYGPIGGLIADAAGDLLGTTVNGGANRDGTVFEIARTGTGYASVPTTVVSFNGSDGAFPFAGLVVDAAGDLFGTTGAGGAHGDGAVFEIAKTARGYAGRPTMLASFSGTDGGALRRV